MEGVCETVTLNDREERHSSWRRQQGWQGQETEGHNEVRGLSNNPQTRVMEKRVMLLGSTGETDRFHLLCDWKDKHREKSKKQGGHGGDVRTENRWKQKNYLRASEGQISKAENSLQHRPFTNIPKYMN